MKKNALQFILIGVIGLQTIITAFGQQLGKPFVQTFPPSKYKADGQNWKTAQDSRGMIYVRNNEVLLEYDGVNWRQIGFPSSQFYDFTLSSNDVIHVVIDNDFGYVMPDEQGSWEFISFKPKAGRTDIPFLRYAYSSGKNVFLYGAELGFIYNIETHQLDSIHPTLPFGPGFDMEGVFVMQQGTLQDGYAWKKWTGSEFAPLPFSEGFPGGGTVFMLPYGPDRFLLGNSDDGFFIYDLNAGSLKTAFRKLNTDIDGFVRKNRMTHGTVLPNGSYAISTTTGGIVVIDKEGNWLQWVNKKSGLIDDNIYHLYADNQNGIWAAGIGLNRVELGSPISNWYDEVGGWVTALGNHGGSIYAGAQGAYYLDEEGFQPIKGMAKSKRAWTFYNYHLPNRNDSILLMGVDDGVYQVQGDETKVLLQGTTTFKFLRSPSDPSKVYAANPNQITIYKYNKEEWIETQVIDGFTGSVRSLAEDKKGNLWLGTYRRGIKYIDFSTELQNPLVTDRNNGLPNAEHVMVYPIDGGTYFATSQGIYEYDEGKDEFFLSPQYKEVFEKYKRDSYIIHQNPEKELWIAGFKTNEQPIAKLMKNERGSYSWYDKPYKRLPAIEMEVIMEDEFGVTWIGGSEGLFRFDNNVEREYERPYEAYIRRVAIGEDSVFFKGAFYNETISATGDTIRTVRTGQATDDVPVFEYDYNSVTFNFAAPSFDNSEDANEYRYFLEGYQKQWSDWAKDTRQSYTNLSEGDYTFKVKARNAYGVESEAANYAFTITPPWYRAYWAYSSYLVLGGLFVFLLVRLNTQRLQAQNRNLEMTVQKRTAEIAKQKEEIEKSYTNVATISEIGQKITATLDFDALVKGVYNSVNQLMDASAFGVGIHQPDQDRLEFRGFIEKGETLSAEYDYLRDERKISVWSFKNLRPVFINDMPNEYKMYTGFVYSKGEGENIQSAIYLPLIVEGEPIGVITVQSYEPDAYSERDLTMLQTLASYISIAFANNQSFEVIKEKNEQITDSIRYAETIQMAVLPSKQRMNEALHDYFVIWQPKDIVSGDFYWFNHQEDKIFLATVDCTGHGVPGAFMSMIGNALLNEIVNVERIQSPARILERMHYHIRIALRQEEKKNMDGMDVGMVMMETIEGNLDDIRITFAGAKMPLYYVKENELLELKGDRKSIGGMQREEKRIFTNKEIILQTGDCFYLCTDGFVDQHNPDKKKIGSLRLKELLKVSISMEMKEQNEMLLNALLNHKRDAIQRDDITIIGVKV